jgi:hypothetical protein
MPAQTTRLQVAGEDFAISLKAFHLFTRSAERHNDTSLPFIERRNLERPMRISAIVACLAMTGILLMERNPANTTCLVRLSLTDAETGKELPGLVHIVDAEGRTVSSNKLLSRGLGLESDLPIQKWLVVPRAVEFELPRGTYTISAISGLETEQARREVKLEGLAEARITIPLTRFANPAEENFRSGNTHLHLMKVSRETADRYLREVPAADRLDVLFLSYLERAEADRDYISNRYAAADLEQLTRESRVIFGNGEEHRHNFTAQGEGFGHVMFLNLRQLIQPVSIGPGIMRTGHDGLPLQRGIDAARKDGATAIWCHNEWGLEALPNWFSGRIAAQNIFDGGIRSSYKDSFYRYLNAGLTVPFSTGTDWFMYDFSRVYVHVEGELTTAKWLKELAAGRSFITNGPLLSLRVDDRSSGDTLELVEPGTVRIAAQAAGRVDFERIELIRDGDVVAVAKSRPVAGHHEAELRITLEIGQPCWLALRTPPQSVLDNPELKSPTPLNELGRELFSHTSPVYIKVAGRSVFNSRVARELLDKMNKNRALVAEQGRFEDDLAKARVLDVYDEGINILERRLQDQR